MEDETNYIPIPRSAYDIIRSLDYDVQRDFFVGCAVYGFERKEIEMSGEAKAVFDALVRPLIEEG